MGIKKPLTVIGVQSKKKPGYYGDGGGLYLQVGPRGSKSWIFRFTMHDKRREMGLGSLNALPLADARAKAASCRKLVNDGIDPVDARARERRQNAADAARAMTFEEASEAYIKKEKPSWKSAKSELQWRQTLRDYCWPVFGNLPVSEVDTQLVMKVLEPIWTVKTETATRVRSRIESILNWATTSGFRGGENPARWKGHLEYLLANIPKSARVKHHAAMPVDEMCEFMPSLRAMEGIAPLALNFLILTAARTENVISAERSQFNADLTIWTIPGEQMKGRRGSRPAHRVPLSPAAAAIVRERMNHSGRWIFPGDKPNERLSENAMLEVIKRMGLKEIATPHGFRSTFRDWAEEKTTFHPNIAEMALAHKIRNDTEAAYRRGDVFEKRCQLMKAWADFCAKGPVAEKVTPIHRRAKTAA